METVDFGLTGDHADNVKDFLEEQLAVVTGMLKAVVEDPDPKNDPFNELMSYVKGAIQAAEEAIAEAWPHLRDDGELSREAFEKVSMTGALCGAVLDRASQMLKPLEGGPAMIMLITLVMNDGQSSDTANMKMRAVTTRALADELLKRARRSEEEERA